MRTIPDTIDLIKKKLNLLDQLLLDRYYSIIETIGSKMSVYGGIKDGAIDRKAQVIESEICRKILREVKGGP